MRNMGETKLTSKTKATHLLLVSVMISLSSLLVCFGPSLLALFLHYCNFNFSFSFSFSFPSKIFSHTIDKNCIFLLCNGLLVFLGITTSFSTSSPPHDDLFHHYSHDYDASEDEVIRVSEIAAEMMQEDDPDTDADADADEVSGVLLGLELKEEEEWLEDDDEIVDAESVEDEEENWMLSTEQMNKKFDDFIRRMKEDLRIEAKRQLVMVHN
ncbi:uncharacterized protein LOC129304109 [Prosopis cineraria]|uniref:uncharacterized protein LOC129304109 n=1 Tax=Prosopis cineraria TaxID=364024 RepID=UPI002410141C|nr:uncharacterized protein LOC129304109 [Prosopis cineraria]